MAGYLTLLDVWAEIDCPLYWPPISWNWDLFSIFETFIIFWSRRFLLRYQIYLIQSSTSFQEESNPPRKFHCLICGGSCLRIAEKKKRLCASTTFLEAIAGVGKRNQAQKTRKNTIIPWAPQGSKDYKRYSQTGKGEPHLVLYFSHVQSLPVTQILQTTSSIWLCLTDLRLVNLIDLRPLTFHNGLDVDDFRNLKFS